MMASFPYATCNGKKVLLTGPLVTRVDSLPLSYTLQETAKDINLQQHHATNMSSYILLQLTGSYVANLQ